MYDSITNIILQSVPPHTLDYYNTANKVLQLTTPHSQTN